jgi:hypothetical protein
MATVKLTTGIREDISKKVIRHRFLEEHQALIKQGAALAELIYNDVFKKKERELMESLPEGWLPTDNDISFQSSSGYNRLYFNGKFYVEGLPNPALEEFRRFPKCRMSGAAKVYEAGEAIDKKIEELLDARKDFEERYAKTKRQVMASLNSVTTLGKLKSVWPEIAPFCPDEEPGQALAIPTEQLNALLKLPAKEAA